jgi:hypothetical protein
MSRHFLERLTVVYGEPETSDNAGFFDEYRRGLGEYSADVMDRAIDRMLRERKFRSWPTIGELRKHANEVLEAAGARTKGPDTWAAKKADASERAKRFAYDAQRQTALGRAAEAEDWARAFRGVVYGWAARQFAFDRAVSFEAVSSLFDGDMIRYFRRYQRDTLGQQISEGPSGSFSPVGLSEVSRRITGEV